MCVPSLPAHPCPSLPCPHSLLFTSRYRHAPVPCHGSLQTASLTSSSSTLHQDTGSQPLLCNISSLENNLITLQNLRIGDESSFSGSVPTRRGANGGGGEKELSHGGLAKEAEKSETFGQRSSSWTAGLKAKCSHAAGGVAKDRRSISEEFRPDGAHNASGVATPWSSVLKSNRSYLS